jgi:hypothetical protein
MRSRRGGTAARLAGAGLAVLLAAVGATAYLIIDRVGDSPLPTRVLGTQAVAVVSPGAAGPTGWSGSGPAPGTLLDSAGRLTFSAGAQAGAGWTADQMAGGTYILIYLANGGLCLTSPALPASAAVLARCDLAANQRWVRVGPTTGGGGLDYWQLRNDADGRCLAAGSPVVAIGQSAKGSGAAGGSGQVAQMQSCQTVPSWHQLVTFVQSS